MLVPCKIDWFIQACRSNPVIVGYRLFSVRSGSSMPFQKVKW